MDSGSLSPPRVFLGLTEVAGYYTRLERGFRELGIETVFVDLGENRFAYEGGKPANRLIGVAQAFGRRRAATPRAKLLRKVFWSGLQRAASLPLMIWALARYDVFIFGYTTSFVALQELRLLKLAGKRVIYVFHGGDSRPPYLEGFTVAAGWASTPEQCIRLTRRQKRRIRLVERYADAVVSFPLHCHLHEREIVFSTLLGIPIELPRLSPAREPGPVRVVHAPSVPEAKGTPLIRRAVEDVRRQGHDVELIELTNRTHDEVLRELERCDIVVDQAYSDAPMAGLATEAACFGKPTLVSGYAGNEIRELFKPEDLPPTRYVHPSELGSALEELVVDSGLRMDLGRRAREYVQRWQPRLVAERYLRVAAADIPAGWRFDPTSLTYLHGCGFSEERVREMIGAVVASGGVGALEVADKPDLERALLAFARQT